MSVTYSLDGNVARIVLDDGKVNAMRQELFDELNAALDRAEQDRPGAVVIAGRPGVLSAGLDLKLLPTLPADALRRTLVDFGRTMLRVFTFPLPTVAAVTGHAIAGGAFLAFGCDLRVMADGPFRLHVNEVAIGLTVPTWANAIAESVIDVRWRTEAILHARPYTPAEALARAFVSEVCPPENVVARARELAASLTSLDSRGYAVSKLRARTVAVRHAESTLEQEMTALPAGAARR
jgi:enoyl-CoA hydratase